jgi:hypothetical protein
MATPSQDATADVIDSSKYIRTFAMDMAAAQGQPAPAPQPNPQPATAAPVHVRPGMITTDGVDLPEVDESLITLAKKDDEMLDLSDAATSGPSSIFERIGREKPSEAEHAFTPGKPMMPTTPIAPTPAAPLPPELHEQRQSILDRLKNRASAPVAPMSAPVPPLTEPGLPPLSRKPSAPPPTYVPPPVPMPGALPPLPTASVAAPVAMPGSYHTYTTDFAGQTKTRQANAFSVLAADADAHVSAPETLREKKSLNLAPVLAAFAVLVILGSAIAGGAYWYTHRKPVVAVAPGVVSLIRFDQKKELTGTGPALMTALGDASGEPLTEGSVLLTYITSASTTATGILHVPEPGGKLIAALPLHAPDVLLRNSAPESTVGVVHAGAETRPFFILKVLSYARTFDGMLGWEATMKQDLNVLYPAYLAPVVPVVIAPVATSTPATTTVTKIVKGKRVTEVVPVPVPAPIIPATPVIPPDPTTFTDAVVDNHDVRILRNGSGKTLMLYGYRDQNTLIVARDEAAFTLLVDRLNQMGKQ